MNTTSVRVTVWAFVTLVGLFAPAALAGADQNIAFTTPPGWSDRLVISNATGVGSTVDTAVSVNDTVYIDFALTNTGTVNIATPFQVRILINGVQFGATRTQNGLNAGQVATFEDISLGKLALGSPVIAIQLDTPVDNPALDAVDETNEADNVYSRNVDVTAPTPVITSLNPPPATEGIFYRFQLTATNSPTSFNTSLLPSGFVLFTDTNGTYIQGTPNPSAIGSLSVTLSATNANGSGQAAVTLTVNARPPFITSPGSATALIGRPFSYSITAIGSPIISYAASPLPAGLTFTGSLISGTPTQGGNVKITMIAANSAGTNSRDLDLTVQSPPIISSLLLKAANVGQAFNYSITASQSPTAFAANIIEINGVTQAGTGIQLTGTGTAGTNGLQINSSTGVISANTAFFTNPGQFVLRIRAGGTTFGRQLTGTVTTAGTAVTGAGTFFSTELVVGDNIQIAGQQRRITAIGSDTGLTIVAATTPNVVAPTAANSTLYGTGRLVLGVAGLVVSTPAITSPLGTAALPITAIESDSFAYGITATNNPTAFIAIVASGPAGPAYPVDLSAANFSGLVLDPASGIISGVPLLAAASPTQYVIELRAQNGAGISPAATTQMRLRIDLAVPRVNSPKAVTFLATGTTNFQYQVSGLYTDPNQYNPITYNAGNLPGFLTIDSANGLIQSVSNVTRSQVGVYAIDLSITNNRGAGPISPLVLTISEAAGPVFTNLKSTIGIAGAPFAFFMRTNTTVGFTEAGATTDNRTTALDNGAPDLNLSLDVNTGLISGTIPAMTPPGLYTTEIHAVDNVPTESAFLLTIQVINTLPLNAPRFNNALVANGTAGLPFDFDVTIAGSSVGEPVPNVPAYIGAFPLSLGTSIQNTTLFVPSEVAPISGLPTQAGTTFVTLSGVNPSGSDVTTLVITINNIAITSARLVTGEVGQILTPYQVTATGLPVQYGASGLPAGLTLNKNTGMVTGIPAEAISVQTDFPVVISASNAFVTGSATVIFRIDPPGVGAPRIINNPLTAIASDNVPFTFQILTDMDGAITSYSAVGLPAGFVLDNDPGSPTGTFGQISGTSSQLGLYSVVITASVGNATDAKVLNLSVSPIPPSNVAPTLITGLVGQNLNVPIAATGSTPLFHTIPAIQPPPPPGILPGLPPGISLVSGIFQGIPTTPGNYQIELQTQNAASSIQTIINFTIQLSPSIADPGPLTAIVGDTTFSYTPVVVGTPPPTVTLSPVVPGMNVVGGSLVGNPAPSTPGITLVTVRADNGVGPIATRQVSITISDMQITSGLIRTGAVGQDFDYILTATGNPNSFSFGNPANFPPGVLLIAPDRIKGIAMRAGGYIVPLTVSNAGGGTASANLQIGISSVPGAPAIISNLLHTGVVNQPLAPQYVIIGTNAPQSYSAVITSGPVGPTYPITLTNFVNPQTGLRLNTNVITGTVLLPGTFTINITATNGVGSGSANLQLAISSVTGGPAITSRLTDNATTGLFYSYKITATNAPIGLNNFALTTPLPAGTWSFNADTGDLSGTPSAAGVSTIGLKVTTNVGTADANLILSIATGTPTITSSLLINLSIGDTLDYTAMATGLPTITFTYSGNPPPSVPLPVPGDPRLFGVLTQEGSFNLTLTATNGLPPDDVRTLTIIVGPTKPTLTTPSSKIGKVGLAFNLPMTANGSTPITYTLAGTLPPGLTFNGTAITGTPSEAGTFPGIVITATHTPAAPTPSQGSDTKSLTIIIQDRDEDTDSDGFPDEFETAFGSNPLDPASTPFGAGKPAGTLQVINVKSTAIKLGFPPAGRDSIKVTGSFAVPDGFTAGGKDATFFVGGILRTFNLDSKGNRKTGGDSLKITVKSGVAKFTGSFSGGTFSDDLEDEGLTGTKGQLGVSRQVRIIIMINNTIYQSKKLLSYSNKTGKTGSAKQVD